MTTDLNILCAEAMGMPAPFYGTMEMKFPGPQPGTYRGDVPAYTTSPAAALDLVEALRKEGYTCELANLYEEQWECWFQKNSFGHGEPEIKYARAATLPLAIVTAFLAVKGRGTKI